MYAKVVDNKVILVVPLEVKQLVDQTEGSQGQWLETDTDMFAGINRAGGAPLRYNFAQVGSTYDPIKDAFIDPKPFPSWKFNADTCSWEAPVAPPLPKPDGDMFPPGDLFDWNEAEQKWEVMSFDEFQKKHNITLPDNTPGLSR